MQAHAADGFTNTSVVRENAEQPKQKAKQKKAAPPLVMAFRSAEDILARGHLETLNEYKRLIVLYTKLKEAWSRVSEVVQQTQNIARLDAELIYEKHVATLPASTTQFHYETQSGAPEPLVRQGYLQRVQANHAVQGLALENQLRVLQVAANKGGGMIPYIENFLMPREADAAAALNDEQRNEMKKSIWVLFSRGFVLDRPIGFRRTRR